MTELAFKRLQATLFLEPVVQGKDSITERDLRPILAVADWKKQRRMWKKDYCNSNGLGLGK